MSEVLSRVMGESEVGRRVMGESEVVSRVMGESEVGSRVMVRARIKVSSECSRRTMNVSGMGARAGRRITRLGRQSLTVCIIDAGKCLAGCSDFLISLVLCPGLRVTVKVRLSSLSRDRNVTASHSSGPNGGHALAQCWSGVGWPWPSTTSMHLLARHVYRRDFGGAGVGL